MSKQFATAEVGAVMEFMASADHVAEVGEDGKHRTVIGEPVVLPDDATDFSFFAHRDDWPDTGADVIRCCARLSLDGGKTWSPDPSGETEWPWGVFPVMFGASGGYSKDDHSGMHPFPVPPGAGRMVRLEITPLIDLSTTIKGLSLAKEQA